jgi:hypothetical protein
MVPDAELRAKDGLPDRTVYGANRDAPLITFTPGTALQF